MDALLANITWNPYGWRNFYTNPKAGHDYARKHPGHESFNYKFDKKGIDSGDKVYGYIQWTNPPRKFTDGGVILFYTKNLDIGKNEIVGVYGNTNILRPSLRRKWQGFKNNMINLNVSASKSESLLFPVPLDAGKYFSDMRSQVGYKNISLKLAINIISDEFTELLKSGATIEERKKLATLYKAMTGSDLYIDQASKDVGEQEELSKIVARQDKEQVIRELKAIKPESPEIITVKGKKYNRDNKTIAQLKFVRDYKCQICGSYILKKDGSFYVEAAHILRKSHRGSETPENILILCPNHHKEFDLGRREIIEHIKKQIVFNLNGINYNINLTL